MNEIYDEFGNIKPHPNLDTSGISYEELSESSSGAKKYALKRIAYLRSLYDEYMRLHQEWIKLKAEYEKYVALNNVLQLENLKQKAKRFVLLNPMLQDKDHATAEELLGEMANSIERIEAEFSKYYLEYMEHKDKYVKEAMGNNVRTLSHTRALAKNFFYNFEIDDFEKHRLLEIKHIDKDKMHTKLFNCGISLCFYPTEVRNAGTTTKVAGWGAIEFCRAFDSTTYKQLGMRAHQWLFSNYMNKYLEVCFKDAKNLTSDTSYQFTEEMFNAVFGSTKFPVTLPNVQLKNDYYDVDFTIFYHPIKTGGVGTPNHNVRTIEDVTNDDNVYKYPFISYITPLDHFGPDTRNNHDRNYMWWNTHYGVKLSFDYDVIKYRKRQQIQQEIIDKALESREIIEYASEAQKQAERDFNYKTALNHITDLRNARRNAKRWLLSNPYMSFTNFTPANFKELDLPTMQELEAMVADTEIKRDSALVSIEATQKHNNIVGLLNARTNAITFLHNKEIIGERDFVDYTDKELFEIFYKFNKHKQQYEEAIVKVNINHFLNAKADVKQFMHFYPMWSKWFYIDPKPIAPPPPAPEPEVEPEPEPPKEPEVETPPVVEDVEPPVEVPEIPQTPAETPDNTSEPNFTNEELAVVLCNRARYEDLKGFSKDLWRLLSPPADENFGYDPEESISQAIDGTYQQMRQDITTLQAKETAPTLKAMEVDRLKEAVKFIGRMGALMGGGASGGSGMFEWWEEVPTLAPDQEHYQDVVDKVNQILPNYFVLPMKTKEDFLFNYYLASMGNSRGIGGYSGMLQIMEWYIACAYEDSMWFAENLANIPLSKIEAYSYLHYIVNNAPYNTFSDEASKKEFASFYLSQLVMSGKTGGGSGKTKEQILAEINVKTIDEKLDQIGEDFYNRAVESGVTITQAEFAVFNDSSMTPTNGALIYVFASILAAAGKDTAIISVFNELFAQQGITSTTKEQNVRVYRKIKELFLALENS